MELAEGRPVRCRPPPPSWLQHRRGLGQRAWRPRSVFVTWRDYLAEPATTSREAHRLASHRTRSAHLAVFAVILCALATFVATTFRLESESPRITSPRSVPGSRSKMRCENWWSSLSVM